jgi:hypothetical protein
MPDDFFSDMFDFGGQGRGWRSGFAILGLLIGAGVGAYLGWSSGGFLAALGGVGTGGLIGWVVGVFLRGVFFYLVIFLICLAGVFGWEWLTGGL